MATKNSTRSTSTTRAPKGETTSLKLVQTTPKKSSAPRLRAGIIEGTCGEDAGPYPSLPADVQRVLDRKTRALADEAFEVIRESLVRNVGCHCFYGRSYKDFSAEQALQLIAEASLDTAMATLAQSALNHSRMGVEMMARTAERELRNIDNELRRFDLARKKGGAA